MKVFHVVCGPNWGGSYNLATRLCIQQRKLGIEASVCHLEGGAAKQRVTALGAPLVSYDPATGFSSKLARWKDLEAGYRRLVEEHRPDVLQTHDTLSHLLTGWVLKTAPGPKWVALFHQSWKQYGYDTSSGMPWKKYYEMLRHGLGDVWATRKCDCITTVSEAIRRDLCRFGMRKTQVRTLYNGVIPQDTSNVPDLRREWGIPAEATIVHSLGYFDARKGFDLLLGAFELIAARHPQAYLVVAGGNIGADTSYRERIERMREASAHRSRILVLGEQSPGHHFLMNGDVLVIASRQEPASGVLMEAMHLGKASVVTSAGGSHELARDERESLVFESGNIRDLAEKIERLLRDQNLREQLAKAALSRAQTEFTMERCARDYIALYKEILAGT